MAKARITPPRATPAAARRRRSASRVLRTQPRQVDQRAAGGHAADHEQHAARRSRPAPSGVSQRPSPAYGMNSSPQVGRAAGRRAGRDQPAGAEGHQRAAATPDQVGAGRVARSGEPRWLAVRGRASERMAAASTRPTARLIAKIARQSATASTTAPNSGPSDAADLLDGGDDAERHAAALDGVEVGDQGQRGRHQPAAADALQEPAGDHAGQVVGQGGDQRPDREDHQRRHEHRHPAAQVGDPADQRQHRDVAEQEAGDDRRRPLQLVDGDADAAHHVGQREHDDVGVGRREGHGDRGQAEQQPRAPRRSTRSRGGDVLLGAVVVEADGVGHRRRCRGRTRRSARAVRSSPSSVIV